jgi:hypothetical protein
MKGRQTGPAAARWRRRNIVLPRRSRSSMICFAVAFRSEPAAVEKPHVIACQAWATHSTFWRPSLTANGACSGYSNRRWTMSAHTSEPGVSACLSCSPDLHARNSCFRNATARREGEATPIRTERPSAAVCSSDHTALREARGSPMLCFTSRRPRHAMIGENADRNVKQARDGGVVLPGPGISGTAGLVA